MNANPLNFLNQLRNLTMKKKERADELVQKQVLWAIGAGLLPVPILDVAAVTTVQINMVQKLCELYEVDYNNHTSTSLVTALASSTLARLGASMIKAIPLIGPLVGAASMSILSGGSTYALGQVFIRHFEGGGTLQNFDLAAGRKIFEEELEKGKAFAEKLQREQQEKERGPSTPADAAKQDVFAKLEKLSQLRQRGVISEEEFQTKKMELLSQV